MTNIKLCVLAALLCMHSCNGGNTEVEEGIAQLQSRRIQLPLDSFLVVGGTEEEGGQADFRQVVYLDEFDCTKCAIKSISRTWSAFISNDSISTDRLRYVFVLSTSGYVLQELEQTIENTGFEHALYIDTAGVFARMNPHIPEKGMFHTFMIDRNDSVVLVGDPARNMKVRELMYRIINN